MNYETLTFKVADQVATITLNRPPGNALSLGMARDLMQVSIRCATDPEVRAVVITGAGKLFCAGGDLKSFADAGAQLPALLAEITTNLHAAVARFARMNAPLICAVNGTAAGAGMSLACIGDLVLAGQSAKFTMAYTRAGLVPDGGSTWLLPRLVGQRRAAELMLTNRILSAEEAADWQLVTRVVPDQELAAAANELARELAAGPTFALGQVKKLLQLSGSTALEAQLEAESQAISSAGGTADGQEGIAAFLGKRAPQFRGR